MRIPLYCWALVLWAVLPAAERCSAQVFNTPAGGGTLTSGRPTTRTTRSLENVGFQRVDRSSVGFGSRGGGVATVSGSTSSRLPSGLSGGAGGGTVYGGGGAGLSRQIRNNAQAQRWAARYELGSNIPYNFRQKNYALNLDALPSTRHAVVPVIDELPFSAVSALRGGKQVVAYDSTGPRAEVSTAFSPSLPGDETVTMSDAMGQRIERRKEMLLIKGRDEFKAGEYQRAFAQFALADSVGGPSETTAKKLVILSSIASGNFSRGVQDLYKLLESDESLFVEEERGVEWLYPNVTDDPDADTELYLKHIALLKNLRTRTGDGSAIILYPFALWWTGEKNEARIAATEIVDEARNSPIAGYARKMLDRMDGKPLQSLETPTYSWD